MFFFNAILWAGLLAYFPPTTTLGSGELIFTGYNADEGEDGLSFMVLVPVAAGTQVHFTDKGWLASGGFRSGEGVLTWTAAAALSTGDQIHLYSSDNGLTWTASDGGTVTETGTFLPSLTGDQFTAFQGTVTGTNSITLNALITSIDFYNQGSSSNAFDSDAADSQTSALPAGLTLGVNALAVGTSNSLDDNARLVYEASHLVSGTANLQAHACSAVNWETDGEMNFTLPPAPSNTWNGSTWSSGSPAANQILRINNAADWVLTANENAQELFTGSGSTVTIPSGITLTLGGDLALSGSLTGPGTLRLETGSSVRLREPLTFEGQLEVAAGTELLTNDQLTLAASGVGTYGCLTGEGSVTGNVSVQHYLPLSGGAADGRYFHLSAPVVTTYSDFNSGELQVASTGSDGSVWYWNASEASWSPPVSVSDQMPLGAGTTMYAGTFGGLNFLLAEPGAIEVSGTAAMTDVSLSLGYNRGQNAAVDFLQAADPQNPTVEESEGWNFLGNPFPAVYDWDGQTLPAGLSGACYVWNGSTYQAYVGGVGINGGTRYLAPFQAFWVQLADSGAVSFTFEADQRVAGTATQLFRSMPVGVWLRTNGDEVYLGYDPAASDQFDQTSDARKLSGDLAVVYGGSAYGICRVAPGERTSFPLSYRGAPGMVTLEAKDSLLPPGTELWLEDRLVPGRFNLRRSNYTFQSLPTDPEPRFVVHMGDGLQTEVNTRSFHAYFKEGYLIVELPEAGELLVTDVLGRILHQGPAVAGTNQIPVASNFAVLTFRSPAGQGVVRLVKL